MSRRTHVATVCSMLLLGLGFDCAWAQNTAQANPSNQPGPKLGWSNSTDLSLVVTAGNSATQTFGFVDRLRYAWPTARFSFDVNLVRSDTSDDRYYLVEPGLEFPVGARPSNPAISLIEPGPTPDVGKYSAGGRYDSDISMRFFWNVGAGWDRNIDAGILRRYVTFAGIGNTWAHTGRRRFVTNTTIDSDFMSNISFADASDMSLNTTNAVSVMMNNHLSLKASVQWLFENEPALETDLDVVAFAEIINPDGVPGTGDERFRTLASGGTKLVLGTKDARKAKLDTVIRTAFVVSF